MKKYCIIISISLWQMWAFAAHVSVEKAQTVGEHFLSQQSQLNSILPVQLNLQLVYTEGVEDNHQKSVEDGITYFYVFNADNQGFVIVAGDDRVVPILGYSKEGYFDPNNVPENCRAWLDNYKAIIDYVVENDIVINMVIEQRWSDYYNNVNQKRHKSSVAPLLTSTWNQGSTSGIGTYNLLCPYDTSTNKRTYTGCVATAMAQVMNYWQHPVQGTGSHSYTHATYGTLSANFDTTTYDWANMPNSINTSSSLTARTAIATLMYHCGVSVEMKYGTSGSSAPVNSSSRPCTVSALKNNFGYKNSLHGVYRSAYSDAAWIGLLKSELDAQRPVIYAGYNSSSGHAFVCDGYDENDYFHINWGWGGTSNGYFYVDSLNPLSQGAGGSDNGYNEDQEIVVGVEPQIGDQIDTAFNIMLYDSLSISDTLIPYKGGFSVSTTVWNLGSDYFSGQYAAAVFDANDNFMGYIQILTSTSTLPVRYIHNRTFTTSGMSNLLPGNYYVSIYFRPFSGEWTKIPDAQLFANRVNFTIYHHAEIETYSNFILDKDTLVKGKNALVSVNLLNDNITGTYSGKYRICLLDTATIQVIQTIAEVDENEGLTAGDSYPNPIDFSCDKITADTGKYLLAVQYYKNNAWQLAGSHYYTNPVSIYVALQTDNADLDTLTVNEGTLTPVFNTNILNYTVTVPYNVTSITINAKANDTNATVNGCGNFPLNVGQNPFSVTVTALDSITQKNYTIIVTRENQTNVTENSSLALQIYPNPASSELKIKNEQLKDGETVEIVDVLGRVQQTSIINQQSEIILDISHLPQGMYFIKIGKYRGKFVKQ
ncbi:MAG: C10 family peptidase [Bacteroidales bacterium]|jgi:hypothetical protein|nr:C10 family peptidase [Bacteroidales bacterium]